MKISTLVSSPWFRALKPIGFGEGQGPRFEGATRRGPDSDSGGCLFYSARWRRPQICTQTRPIRPESSGGVGPESSGEVWGLKSLGFEGPRAVNGASG